METGIKRHKQSLTDQLIAQCGWIPGRYFFIQKIRFEQRTVLNRYPTQAEVPHDHGQTRLPLNDALRTQSNDLQTCAEDSADPAMMKVDVFRQLAPYEVEDNDIAVLECESLRLFGASNIYVSAVCLTIKTEYRCKPEADNIGPPIPSISLWFRDVHRAEVLRIRAHHSVEEIHHFLRRVARFDRFRNGIVTRIRDTSGLFSSEPSIATRST